MTNKEIDYLPAGRQMNELVAEKVFGWTHYPDDLWLRMKAWLIQRREFNWDERTPESNTPRMMILPDGQSQWPREFSTRDSDALTVLAKFSRFSISSNQESFYVEVGLAEDLNNSSGMAESLALAICRAALKARNSGYSAPDSINISIYAQT